MQEVNRESNRERADVAGHSPTITFSSIPTAEDSGISVWHSPARREGSWFKVTEGSVPTNGVRLFTDSNGYGFDIEKGIYSERRRGTKKSHHCLQV